MTHDQSGLAGPAGAGHRGSGDVGRAIAETLAAAGAQVAVHYRKGLDEAETAVAAIQKQGGKTQAFQADVADPAAVPHYRHHLRGTQISAQFTAGMP